MKTDKQVVLLEGQQLQVRAKTDELTSEIGNELRVHQAMVRRGLALEMSNLGTYAVHEKVMRYLMNHLNKPAPPGYKPASIDAILRADKELWTRVADQVRSDLRADRNGEMPVDIAFNSFTPQLLWFSICFHCQQVAVQMLESKGRHLMRSQLLQRRSLSHRPKRNLAIGKVAQTCQLGFMDTADGISRSSAFATITTWCMDARTR